MEIRHKGNTGPDPRERPRKSLRRWQKGNSKDSWTAVLELSPPRLKQVRRCPQTWLGEGDTEANLKDLNILKYNFNKFNKIHFPYREGSME